MMTQQVQPDTFHPPHYKLKPNIESKLDAILKEYASQFAKDETSTGTTPLTEMTIDTGTSDLVSQKPYSIAMKNYQWVKDEIVTLLTGKVICSSRFSWSVPIIVVPKGDGGKQLVISYHALNKVTRKFTWPMPKVDNIFSKLNGAKYFPPWIYELVTTIYLLINLPYQKQHSIHHLASMNTSKYPSALHRLQHSSRN